MYGDNDLNTFAKKIKLDPPTTYIFSDVGLPDIRYSGELGGDARVFISFVAPTSGDRLILRVKHSGTGDGPLEVTLGSTKIQLNPSQSSPARHILLDLPVYRTQSDISPSRSYFTRHRIA
jgi:hypothetical protein